MRNLLKVSGRRLLRDRVFLFALAVTLLLSLYISLTNAPAMAEWAKTDEEVCLEDCYYNLAPMLGIVFAAFVSPFLGVEHSDGGLRNKLIAGHSRTSVFLSLFLVSALGCGMITVVWLVGGLPGLLYFDGFSFGWRGYAASVGVALCSALLFAALYTVLSLLADNKVLSAVVCLVVWFVMLFVGSILVNALDAPEFISGYEVAMQGDTLVSGAPYPNPAYVSGTSRVVLTAATHILPTCPVIRMSNNSFSQSAVEMGCSLGVMAVLLLVGCAVFKKIDLK